MWTRCGAACEFPPVAGRPRSDGEVGHHGAPEQVGSDLQDLAEIEGATSGRLTAQNQGAADIGTREFLVGVPHAAFINASFSYWLPGELNLFNGPGRSAWYAAFEIETALAEMKFHATRHLARTGDFHATIEFSEMFASFAGEFVDLREIDPSPDCLGLDPATAYPLGNQVAAEARASGRNGIIYPSARRREGTCLVALWPHAVQSVAQGDIWRFTWRGSEEPSVKRVVVSGDPPKGSGVLQ